MKKDKPPEWVLEVRRLREQGLAWWKIREKLRITRPMLLWARGYWAGRGVQLPDRAFKSLRERVKLAKTAIWERGKPKKRIPTRSVVIPVSLLRKAGVNPERTLYCKRIAQPGRIILELYEEG